MESVLDAVVDEGNETRGDDDTVCLLDMSKGLLSR